MRCRSSDLRPSVGRVIPSDKITAISSLVIALGWCGLRRSLGSNADRPYCSHTPVVHNERPATGPAHPHPVPARQNRPVVLLGTAWGHQTAMRMLHEAGFEHVETKHGETDPFNTYYVAKGS